METSKRVLRVSIPGRCESIDVMENHETGTTETASRDGRESMALGRDQLAVSVDDINTFALVSPALIMAVAVAMLLFSCRCRMPFVGDAYCEICDRQWRGRERPRSFLQNTATPWSRHPTAPQQDQSSKLRCTSSRRHRPTCCGCLHRLI